VPLAPAELPDPPLPDPPAAADEPGAAFSLLAEPSPDASPFTTVPSVLTVGLNFYEISNNFAINHQDEEV
jgi:hypothetical protein